MQVTNFSTKDGFAVAKAKFSKATIQIGEGTINNELPLGEVSAEFTGDYQLREGVVAKDGPNKGKTWASSVAIFKTSGTSTGKVSVQMELSSIEKLQAGQAYKLNVTMNEKNPEYRDVRLIEA